MLITMLHAMPIIKYVIIEPTIYIDITPLLPITRSQIVAFWMVDGTVRDNFLFFNVAKMDPADLQDIERFGVIDLWIIADKIDELFTDEFERQRIYASMGRLHLG